MALTITTVAVAAVTNPVEVQTWLTAHATATILAMWNNDNTFFIVYS